MLFAACGKGLIIKPMMLMMMMLCCCCCCSWSQGHLHMSDDTDDSSWQITMGPCRLTVARTCLWPIYHLHFGCQPIARLISLGPLWPLTVLCQHCCLYQTCPSYWLRCDGRRRRRSRQEGKPSQQHLGWTACHPLLFVRLPHRECSLMTFFGDSWNLIQLKLSCVINLEACLVLAQSTISSNF